MGLLDFIKDAGKDLFGGKEGQEADAIKTEVTRALGSNISGLNVTFNAGVATLTGTAKSEAAKDKAALVAGNVRGVTQVNEDGIRVEGAAAAAPAAAPAAPTKAGGAARYHTIQSGETLSSIAKQYYGDANEWQDLFEANREVIEDADKIYPGQQIRIPADLKN